MAPDGFLLERFNFYVDTAERLDARACEPDGATNSVRVTHSPFRLTRTNLRLLYMGKIPVQDMPTIWSTFPIHIWHNYHLARAS